MGDACKGHSPGHLKASVDMTAVLSGADFALNSLVEIEHDNFELAAAAVVTGLRNLLADLI